MENQNQELTLSTSHSQTPSIYSTPQSFEDAQRVCKMLCSSTLVPKEYQGNISNTMIAYEVSVRTGMSPFMVMQNLDIIQGRPSWSSKYVIAALNSCGRFSPLQFHYKELGKQDITYKETSWVKSPNGQSSKQTIEKKITIYDRECYAYARNSFGDVVIGPVISLGMSIKEGWYTKDGSKWVTMPDMMLAYRSAKFFGNLYAPDVLMGMHASDEIQDFTPLQNPTETSAEVVDDSQPATVKILNQKVKNEKPKQNEDEDLM